MNEINVEKLLEPKTYGYEPFEDTTYHFIVIGAGGTGGYLIPSLARMVSIKNNERRALNKKTHSITIVDSDEVEQKNLLRQQFVANDVGKNKAEVMARRYGRSFNEPISYVDRYLENKEQLNELMNKDNSLDVVRVIIDCVDNNKTRLIIKETVDERAKYATKIISLSSGNEETSGQVIFSYRNQAIKKNSVQENVDSPDLFDIFPLATVDKLPTEMSCAESAISAPQNIHTNMTAANILFGFLNKLLNNKTINELAVFFDITTQQNSVFKATESDVKRLLKMTPNNGALLYYFGDEYNKDDADWVFPPKLEDFNVEGKETA